MLTAIHIIPIKVLDQDEALAFYVGKLGFEVDTDVDMGFMRWLTIYLPSDPGCKLLLEVPQAPQVDEATAEQIRDLLTKGHLGVSFIATTDDCRRTHEELRAKGVEFVQDPIEQPYGIDCALRDPFGNYIRINQPATGPVEVSEDDAARWASGG
jgi:catechol 2,3-dioxygenase-like lactoylglutathione lyase family enzyme